MVLEIGRAADHQVTPRLRTKYLAEDKHRHPLDPFITGRHALQQTGFDTFIQSVTSSLVNPSRGSSTAFASTCTARQKARQRTHFMLMVLTHHPYLPVATVFTIRPTDISPPILIAKSRERSMWRTRFSSLRQFHFHGNAKRSQHRHQLIELNRRLPSLDVTDETRENSFRDVQPFGARSDQRGFRSARSSQLSTDVRRTSCGSVGSSSTSWKS